MTGPTCPRCGACDLDFTDHDGACFPACARDLDALDLDDEDAARWEAVDAAAEGPRARWAHD